MFFEQCREKTQNIQENIRKELLKPLSFEIGEYASHSAGYSDSRILFLLILEIALSFF
ncbi:hypothetical protein DB42_EA00180 [Neochlamydia sp. EPS4]|nr:hypothetical protein DB42_EA00180 [Neochlamydia sp. EPS4]